MAARKRSTRTKIPKPSLLVEHVEQAIYLIRGEKVILDVDLAKLYGVETGNLNKAVRRNITRFPADFMFRLSQDEFDNLRFQFGRASWGGRRTPPYAFTEHGIAMLSSVLRSERAALVNIEIMRAFVRVRELLLGHRDLARKLADLEQTVGRHDKEIRAVFDAIRQLLTPLPEKRRRRIGFRKD